MMQATTQPVEPLTYRVDDACAALGLGRSKVYELVRKDKLKLVKIGKRSLITSASMKALVEEGAD